MIAHQGMVELKVGRETSIDESVKKPNWRPDEVEISWI
jgi:tRNA A37 threonylcarbamoyltransferase TsaD